MGGIADRSYLEYSGNESLKEAAGQMAEIIMRTYERDHLGGSGLSWTQVPAIKVEITDQGAVEITNADKENHSTRGIGFIAGTIRGIGLAKQKNVVLDKKGVTGESMSPCCAALRFDSFADLAETINALALSRDDKIDIDIVRKKSAVISGR